MRIVRIALLAGLLAVASLGFTAGGVAAYGSADGPIAQIEFSLNCNNLSLCNPVPFGYGGVWLWIEIDDPNGDLSDGGTADIAGAGCGHIPGFGGGAEPIRGEATWYWSPTPVPLDATMGTWSDPDNDGWYVLNLGGMSVSFPVTQGHYSAHPFPAGNFELQVAPSGPTS